MRLVFFLFLATTAASARKFQSDDPLLREPAPLDAGAPKSRKLSDLYDLFSLQFADPGELQPKKGPPIRAKAVNTLGDPMDGAWWERRHYWHRLSETELMRGPGDSNPPSRDGAWTIIGAKNEGVTPGFVMLDAKKRMYFVKFDPKSNPEMATAADQITSRLFYAMGYHVPENYLIYFTEEQLVLGDKVELSDPIGRRRKMTRRDLREILMKVPQAAGGKYRATASLALPGKPIGPPRYYGMRTDDPNDIVPHEHRRDQRALQILCAFTGHEDSRAINNLDVVATLKDGTKYVKHFLLDFGSTLGSASTGPNSQRSGAYFFDWKESAKNLFSLGLRVPYYSFAKYPDLPSVGKFESKTFDPVRWVPEYPNPAFLNMLPDDAFWAAKQIMSLTDTDIRAIVETGELSDPKAADWIAKCLIERRDKIGKAFYAQVLPLDRFAVKDGTLTWTDLSNAAGNVTLQWHAFNNETEQRTPLSGATTTKLPPIADGQYYCAELTQASQPKHKIFVYLRPRGGAPEVVGIEREW